MVKPQRNRVTVSRYRAKPVEQVVFEHRQVSRRALNLDKTLLGKMDQCEAAACANAVAFANAIVAVILEAIGEIRFPRAEEFAKALAFNIPMGTWASKEEVLRNPRQIPATAQPRDL